MAKKEINRIALSEAIKLSRELRKIIEKDFNPDVIIAIKDGGVLPAIEVSESLGKPLFKISITRVDAKLLEDQYLNASEIERNEIKDKFDKIWFGTDPVLLEGITDEDLKNKKVLLVDDAIHSGKTMKVAKDYIFGFSPTIIKTAALFYVDTYIPDYFIGKGEKKYPWSTWARYDTAYKDYDDYLSHHGQK